MAKSRLVRVSNDFAQLLEEQKDKLGLDSLSQTTHVLFVQYRTGQLDVLIGNNESGKKRKKARKGVDLFRV